MAGVHSREEMKSLVTDPFIYLTCSHFNKFPMCASQVLGQDLETLGQDKVPAGHWVQTRST